MKRKKNEECKKSQSQITAINIFGFTFNIKNYILFENIVLKKAVYAITFYLQFLCVAGYLKRSNDTPKLNIHKYTNYDIIEIYINRLSTTTQILIAIDYFMLMSEKYFHFRKRQKHVAKTPFSHPVEVTGSMYFGNIFRTVWISIQAFLKKLK